MKKCTRSALELEDGANNGRVRVLSTEPKRAPALGLDVGDKYIHVCFRDLRGEIVSETRVRTTPERLRSHFEPIMRCRVALEVGTHSRWIAQDLEKMGFEVYVANARKLRGIYESDTKTDKSDARFLSQIAAVSPELLFPLKHRGEQAQADLALIRARAALVRSRTLLINHVRTTVKTTGARLSSTSADAFHKQMDAIPDIRHEVLEPVMKQIQQLTAYIRGYNKRIQERVTSYPEAALLMRISGVGPVVALAFICTIEDPHRFQKVRAVGSYLGLRPRVDKSGKISKQLGITKSGDGDLRRLLVNSAQFILGPLSPDTDLKRWGLKLVNRGGTAPKKKAAIAVARKLAVVLLSLWRRGATYEPLRETQAPQESFVERTNVPVESAPTAALRKSESVTREKKGKTAGKSQAPKSAVQNHSQLRPVGTHRRGPAVEASS